MPTLQAVRIGDLDPNPHRQIAVYPLRRAKLDALERSMGDLGCWEGIIARPAGNRFQLAFGHHRLGAARELWGDDGTVPVIVRDLDDGQMLKFMGQENGEDYNADFLVMLETWQAADRFLGDMAPKPVNALKSAVFLGWVREHSDGGAKMTETAQACNAAHNLIANGHLAKSDLDGLAVRDAREICQSLVRELSLIDRKADLETKRAKVGGRDAPTAKQVNRVKKEFVSAGKTVAREVRQGTYTGRKDSIRSDVRNRATDRIIDKGLPDFGAVMRGIRQQAKAWAGAEWDIKVRAVCEARANVTQPEDIDEYRLTANEIGEMIIRASRGKDRLEKAAATDNVSHLTEVV